MPFQAAPFVLATAGVGGIGAGAWHVLTGNSCDSWQTCGGRRKSTWLSERTGSEIITSLYHADPNAARHSNIEGDDNHTGLSPRLSHVVETMAGTQRKGDIPNWRAQRRLEVANRRPVKAEEVSLAEGLRSAFAHENRGPTEAQAAAIRAEKEHFEQREQEKRQRIEAEQARRAELLTLDRQQREHRAQLALEARGAEARAGDKSMGNFLQLDLRDEKQRVAAEVREREQRAREKVLQAHQVRQLPKDYSPAFASRSKPKSPASLPAPSAMAKHEYAPPTRAAAAPRAAQFIVDEVPISMIQQSHNVEERLFAARPAFNTRHAPPDHAQRGGPDEAAGGTHSRHSQQSQTISRQPAVHHPPAPEASTADALLSSTTMPASLNFPASIRPEPGLQPAGQPAPEAWLHREGEGAESSGAPPSTPPPPPGATRGPPQRAQVPGAHGPQVAYPQRSNYLHDSVLPLFQAAWVLSCIFVHVHVCMLVCLHAHECTCICVCAYALRCMFACMRRLGRRRGQCHRRCRRASAFPSCRTRTATCSLRIWCLVGLRLCPGSSSSVIACCQCQDKVWLARLCRRLFGWCWGPRARRSALRL